MGRLFWKFFIFFFLAQLTAVVGVGVAIWWQINQSTLANEGIESSRPARTVVEAAATTLQFGGVDGLKQMLKSWQNRPMPQVHVVDADHHELLNRQLSAKTLSAAQALVASETAEHFIKQVTLPNGQAYILFVPKPTKNAMSPIGDKSPSLTINNRHRPHATWQHLFPFKPLAAGTIVSFLFAFLLAWYFSKPIKRLRYAFAQASEGNLAVRVDETIGRRHDELADLGRDFDGMASRLDALLKGQTRLLHHVSHELRSPLARIQMALGLAEQKPDNIQQSLLRIEREAVRMDRLISGLLEFSRVESGVVSIQKEPCRLSLIIDAVIEDAQIEAQSKHIQFHQACKAPIDVFAQPDLLASAIENVVRNAVKYAPEHSIIKVACESSAQKVLLTIADEGAGVQDAELDTIFKPFIRGQSGTHTEGHGLGLAIAKQVIEAHSGQIVAKNKKDAAGKKTLGFCVEISLPVLNVV
jgi:two-component system, OmpR family, sensor kinase